MKLGFGIKIGLAISILAVGMTSISLGYLYSNTEKMLLEQMGSRLKDIGRTSVNLFTKDDLKLIKIVKDKVEKLAIPTELVVDDIQPGDYRKSLKDADAEKIMSGAEFQKLVSILRKIKEATVEKSEQGSSSNKPTLAYATIMTTTTDDATRKVLRFLADADYNDTELPNPVGNLFYNNSEAIRRAFDNESQADQNFRYEESQYLLSAGIPLLVEDGKVKAILALDYDAQGEANKVLSLRKLSFAVIGASFILSILVAMLIARILNKPIRQLREGALRVSNRDFDLQMSINSGDELGMLSKAFNSMVTEIKDYASNLEQHNEAYAKFVPKEFLKQLGKESILNIKLGDQVQKQMTVLFSDIRSFTAISESMSPRDNFDFINDYLSTVSPIIRANGGFVDKYIGDAVMGLFPDNPENAIKAAIEMQKSLQDFNKRMHEFGRPPVAIGIGIHHGNLMLGTVGESMRMEGTVISDAVNLSSRLEGLTKTYGAEIIISERVYQTVCDRGVYKIRSLGSVQVKGKKNKINIFEVIDTNEEDLARRKLVSQQDFEAGVQAFEKNKFRIALEYFDKALSVAKNDIAAQYFIERAEKSLHLRNGLKSRSKDRRLYSVTSRSTTSK